MYLSSKYLLYHRHNCSFLKSFDLIVIISNIHRSVQNQDSFRDDFRGVRVHHSALRNVHRNGRSGSLRLPSHQNRPAWELTGDSDGGRRNVPRGVPRNDLRDGRHNVRRGAHRSVHCADSQQRPSLRRLLLDQ